MFQVLVATIPTRLCASQRLIIKHTNNTNQLKWFELNKSAQVPIQFNECTRTAHTYEFTSICFTYSQIQTCSINGNPDKNTRRSPVWSFFWNSDAFIEFFGLNFFLLAAKRIGIDFVCVRNAQLAFDDWRKIPEISPAEIVVEAKQSTRGWSLGR